jgi:carbon-monoxide dehydrogenase medium subunit
MRSFEYHKPTSLGEASNLLVDLGADAHVLAGGTDLLVELKENLRVARHAIDIKGIHGLCSRSFDAETGLCFGALVTVRELETWDAVITHYPNLCTALRLLGSIQIRNRATVAGNVCRASPSADTIPPLIADGAEVTIRGPQGERRVLLEHFFTGPGRTVLAPGEIVTGFVVPPPDRQSGRAYIKHGRRKAMELATVGVAVSLAVEGARCREIRIALGAVAPTPIRAGAAEAVLRGNTLDPESIATAARAAMAQSTPISNVRASETYRREMVGVLTRRAIDLAMEASIDPTDKHDR